jgi:hypothetical protein
VSVERSLALIAFRCAVLAGIVLLAAVPVYVFVEPPWRGLVARLAVAFVLGLALLQLRRAAAQRLATGNASALDEARGAAAPQPRVPLRFLELRSDVRAALRSRRYFERVLWPRLAALAPHPLVPPPVRPGRGPSLAGLRRVIDALERRP